MKKFYVILAAVTGMTLTSCTNSEFVGDVATKANSDAISFGGGTSALTRADITGSSAATMLGNEMKVYGVKQDATTTTNYNKVFVDYSVKYDASKAGNEEYNEGWYYVGAESNQTIKFWDYSSANYHFVAGSPVANFSYALDATTGDIATATVTGLGGRLDHVNTVASTATPVYVADPVVVAKANYNKEVQFTFRSMQTKVRVGIYETIPGYKVSSITFYNNAATPVASNYITLNSETDAYFQGGAASGTITYDWTTTPASYSFVYSGSGTLLTQKFWEGGEFTSGVPAVSSIGAIADLYGTETNKDGYGYFVVMPTPSATTATPLTLTCDFELTSIDGSDETINVKGATATIPADYTKWEANKAYTYLFKITKNTNGTTGPGTDPDDPDGLYPIVFDAVVVDYEDNKIGTETTVSTPSITVYQDGDVVENGITYNAGAVEVKAMVGTTDVTSTATWSYYKMSGTTFDYTKDYEKLGASGAATPWTNSALTSVDASSVYVIKAVSGTSTAYFVLVVGAAEEGPANS